MTRRFLTSTPVISCLYLNYAYRAVPYPGSASPLPTVNPIPQLYVTSARVQPCLTRTQVSDHTPRVGTIKPANQTIPSAVEQSTKSPYRCPPIPLLWVPATCRPHLPASAYSNLHAVPVPPLHHLLSAADLRHPSSFHRHVPHVALGARRPRQPRCQRGRHKACHVGYMGSCDHPLPHVRCEWLAPVVLGQPSSPDREVSSSRVFSVADRLPVGYATTPLLVRIV